MAYKQKCLSGLLLATTALCLIQGQTIKATENVEASSTTINSTTSSSSSSISNVTVASKAIDDRVQEWLIKQNFQLVQTLFRTDVEGKAIHENVGGYQTPYNLSGYTYLSTIVTTTDKGPALVHLYQDGSYQDPTIVRTEYLDALTGQKLQADQNGQAFQEAIGELTYYKSVVIEENGEKVYKIFYMTDENYILYAGTPVEFQLSEHTRFIDKETGQEIALDQFGFVPIYEVDGYTYDSSKLSYENSAQYAIHYFTKNGGSTTKANESDNTTNPLESKKDKEPRKSLMTASDQVVENVMNKLPITGETRSKLRILGYVLFFGVGIAAFIAHFKKQD